MGRGIARQFMQLSTPQTPTRSGHRCDSSPIIVHAVRLVRPHVARAFGLRLGQFGAGFSLARQQGAPRRGKLGLGCGQPPHFAGGTAGSDGRAGAGSPQVPTAGVPLPEPRLRGRHLRPSPHEHAENRRAQDGCCQRRQPAGISGSGVDQGRGSNSADQIPTRSSRDRAAGDERQADEPATLQGDDEAGGDRSQADELAHLMDEGVGVGF